MTPLEKFGAMVLRNWNEHDSMDIDGGDIQDMAEKSGVIVLEPYSVEKHGEYMRDAWDTDEGWDINVMAPGVMETVRAAHGEKSSGK